MGLTEPSFLERMELMGLTGSKIVTNYDLLISKTPEELAEIMVGDCPPNYPHGDCHEYERYDGNLDCCKCWLDWLKSPAETEGE